MKNQLPFLLLAIVTIGLFSTGCSNLEITKRRHMPGYHVEFGQKQQQAQPAMETTVADDDSRMEHTTMPPSSAALTIPTDRERSAPEMDGSLTASSAKGIGTTAPSVKKNRSLASLTDELILEPLRDVKRDKVGSELRRSVFAEEGDEKYGWSVVGIIAMALSVIAFIMLLVGIVGLISGAGFWFIPLIFGFIFGLVGMILGIVGLRQTKAGGKKGRGFAIVGMILGILSFALSLIALVVGLVINLNDGNGIFGN